MRGPVSSWAWMGSGFASSRASDPCLPSRNARARQVCPLSPHPCPPGRHIGLSSHPATAGYLRRLKCSLIQQLWPLITGSCSGARHPLNMIHVSQKISSLDASLSLLRFLIRLVFSCSNLSCPSWGSIHSCLAAPSQLRRPPAPWDMFPNLLQCFQPGAFRKASRLCRVRSRDFSMTVRSRDEAQCIRSALPKSLRGPALWPEAPAAEPVD